MAGSLDDAEDRRATLLGRKRKGERVAPSKTTFKEFADSWLEGQAKLRPRTLEAYRHSLEHLAYPALGELRVEAGYRAWTIKGVLTPLSRVFNNAVRRGLIAANPLTLLERSERPSVSRREVPELSEDEIQRLLGVVESRWRPGKIGAGKPAPTGIVVSATSRGYKTGTCSPRAARIWSSAERCSLPSERSSNTCA